jgi:glucose/arabinose dehydrogenase
MMISSDFGASLGALRRGALPALLSAGILVAANADLAAQQQPPPWAQGRPAGQASSTLAPHPPGLTAKAANEIPINKIKVPAGFEVTLWASGVPNARSMTVGDKGTVFVGTRLVGRVYAIVDKGGQREVKTIAQGLHRPNGVAFKDGALYVAELSRVIRFDNIEDRLDNPPEPKVIYSDLPKDEPHGWKFMAFGPDGMLYVPVGAPCNICEPSDQYAQIRRIKPDGSGAEVVARGVRNTVGFDWHPDTRELWFTDNGRDWVDDERPQDELNRLTRVGQHFGYPYCHQGDFPDPEVGKGKSCSEFTAPVLNLGPHVAALGMRFYTGSMFPAEYKNRAIIALHGSWNRTKKSGFNVMQVSFPPNQPPKYEVFAEGWLEGEQFWGRPVDVQVMRDGALLISDDAAGAIYRIAYKR